MDLLEQLECILFHQRFSFHIAALSNRTTQLETALLSHYLADELLPVWNKQEAAHV